MRERGGKIAGKKRDRSGKRGDEGQKWQDMRRNKTNKW